MARADWDDLEGGSRRHQSPSRRHKHSSSSSSRRPASKHASSSSRPDGRRHHGRRREASPSSHGKRSSGGRNRSRGEPRDPILARTSPNATFDSPPSPPITKPARRLDEFDDADAAVAFEWDQDDGVLEKKVSVEVEEFLRSNGLAGSAAYDLRALRQEVDRAIASGEWDEQIMRDESDGGYDAEGDVYFSRGAESANPRSPSFVSPTLSRASSFVSRQSFSRQSSFKGSPSRASMVLGSEFDERAQKLSRFEQASSRRIEKAVLDAERRRAEEEEAARLEQELHDLRPPRPMPTPISDLRQVLGWLERHVPGTAAEHAERRQQAIEASRRKDETGTPGSGGGIARFRTRPAGRLSVAGDDGVAAAAAAVAGDGEAQSGAGVTGLQTPVAEGRTWLEQLRADVEKDAHSGGGSVWQRQALLEAAALDVRRRDPARPLPRARLHLRANS